MNQLNGARPHTEATRRICGSFWYDQYKAHQVLDMVVGQPHRFIAHSRGVDTPLAMRHAAASAHYWMTANLAMVLVPCFTLTLLLWRGGAGFAQAVVMGCFGFVAILVGGRSIGAAAAGWFGRTRWAGSIVGGLVALYLAVALLGAIGPLVAPSIWTLLGPAIVGFSVSMLFAIASYSRKLEPFKSDEWTDLRSLVLDEIIAKSIGDAESSIGIGNATIYSGLWPFIGSGTGLSSWEYALQLKPVFPQHDSPEKQSAAEHQSLPLVEADLSNELVHWIRTYRPVGVDACRWHFIDGETVDELPSLRPSERSRPEGQIDGRSVNSGAISHEVVRPYTWASTVRWRGDVALNSFVRLRPDQGTLFLEISHTALTPLRRRYSLVDISLRTAGWSVWRNLLHLAARNFLLAPQNLWWWMSRHYRWRRTERANQISRSIGAPVDYGALGSVRDLFSEPALSHYFQAMDCVEYIKTINIHIFNAIDYMLKRRGWEIHMRDAVVQQLNSVVINGGVTNSNVSVGDRNTLKTHTPSQAESPSPQST